MKIRQDFVTNSSSTSYIIAMKDEFTQENFFKALGVDDKFLMKDVIIDLFRYIDSDKEKLNSVKDEDLEYCYLSEEATIIVKKLFKKKWNIYHGSFSGDEDMGISHYFCYKKVIYSNDDIYLNSENEYF